MCSEEALRLFQNTSDSGSYRNELVNSGFCPDWRVFRAAPINELFTLGTTNFSQDAEQLKFVDRVTLRSVVAPRFASYYWNHGRNRMAILGWNLQYFDRDHDLISELVIDALSRTDLSTQKDPAGGSEMEGVKIIADKLLDSEALTSHVFEVLQADKELTSRPGFDLMIKNFIRPASYQISRPTFCKNLPTAIGYLDQSLFSDEEYQALERTKDWCARNDR
jgi:hypothetical protein